MVKELVCVGSLVPDTIDENCKKKPNVNPIVEQQGGIFCLFVSFSNEYISELNIVIQTSTDSDQVLFMPLFSCFIIFKFNFTSAGCRNFKLAHNSFA